METKVEIRRISQQVKVLAVSMTEDEWVKAQIDSAEFFAQVRFELGKLNGEAEAKVKVERSKRPKSSRRQKTYAEKLAAGHKRVSAKRYACKECGKAFAKPAWIPKHMLKEHGMSADADDAGSSSTRTTQPSE